MLAASTVANVPDLDGGSQDKLSESVGSMLRLIVRLIGLGEQPPQSE